MLEESLIFLKNTFGKLRHSNARLRFSTNRSRLLPILKFVDYVIIHKESITVKVLCFHKLKEISLSSTLTSL